MMSTAIQNGGWPRGLIVLQVGFAILVILDVVLFEWLRGLHEWPVWQWAWVVVPTLVGLLFLFTGLTNFKDPKLRGWIVKLVLVKVRPLAVLCAILGVMAAVLIWLLVQFYASHFDPITFKEFVRQLSERREEHPAALREFAEDWEGKTIEWDCVIIEAVGSNNAYKIGVTRDAHTKDRAYARFSDSGGFRPSVEGKARIRGTIRKVDELGIRLTDCHFVENGG